MFYVMGPVTGPQTTSSISHPGLFRKALAVDHQYMLFRPYLVC
jgi:hypothetical protein